MLPASVCTALDLKKAIETAPKRLQPIGVCVTKEEIFKLNYDFGFKEDEDEDEDGDEATVCKNLNNLLIKELAAIYKDFGADHYSGVLDAPFTLTVTRPGCEYSGIISNDTDSETEAELLKKWFDHGAVSGYGDVRAQETKVDVQVRDAREIPAAEFSVSPNLVEQIEKCWCAHFIPGAVRVDPYKIHVYGPGGQFKAHKDTPETDLVGTFLVGVGDTTGVAHLDVGEQIRNSRYHRGHDAAAGSWVAFHPDTKHQVSKIKEGYRAVVAFKLFRKDVEESTPMYEDGPESLTRKKMESVLERMHAPYGILLAHSYCMGTTVLSGCDNILGVAAQAVAEKQKASVHFLPVLTQVHAYVYNCDGMDDKEVDAKVFPFTQAHVDILLKEVSGGQTLDEGSESESDDERAEEKDRTQRSLADANAEWLVNAVDVPFYSVDFAKTAATWSCVEEEGAEYTGNEAKPYTEDSIYFSYAMVVLPIVQGQKRGREGDGVGTVSGSSKKRT